MSSQVTPLHLSISYYSSCIGLVYFHRIFFLNVCEIPFLWINFIMPVYITLRKVDLWTLNPCIHNCKAPQSQKEHWPFVVSWLPDSLVDGSCHCVSVSVLENGKKKTKKQQKWKWLDVSAGELSHQRQSSNHSSPSCRETALTRQNLNSARVWKNARVYARSEFQLMDWFSVCVWPPSVSRRMP